MTRRRVREAAPVQVYLVADEQARLERLAEQMDASKSDVVRRALLALERELLSPGAHPALRLIGIADAEKTGVTPLDAAREHDQLLGDAEEAAWTQPTSGRSRQSAKPSGKKRRGR
jgi:predicted transcriptional regulator